MYLFLHVCLIVSASFGLITYSVASAKAVCFIRRTLTWHRPYCIEVNSHTFEKLRQFLEQYAVTLSSHDKPVPPFSTQRHCPSTY